MRVCVCRWLEGCRWVFFATNIREFVSLNQFFFWLQVLIPLKRAIDWVVDLALQTASWNRNLPLHPKLQLWLSPLKMINRALLLMKMEVQRSWHRESATALTRNFTRSTQTLGWEDWGQEDPSGHHLLSLFVFTSASFALGFLPPCLLHRSKQTSLDGISVAFTWKLKATKDSLRKPCRKDIWWISSRLHPQHHLQRAQIAAREWFSLLQYIYSYTPWKLHVSSLAYF